MAEFDVEQIVPHDGAVVAIGMDHTKDYDHHDNSKQEEEEQQHSKECCCKNHESELIQSNDTSKSKKRSKKKPLKFEEYYIPESVHEQKGIDLAFICDATLGRLAKHIRMLGGNCYYESTMTTNYMLYIARTQNRIILTKNRTLINQLGYQRKTMQLKRQKIIELKKNRQPKMERIVTEEHEKEMKELEDIYKEQGLEFNREDFEEFDEYSSEEESSKTNQLESDKDQFGYVYYFVKSRNSKDMINETVNFFKIEFDEDRIFTICINCNSSIVSIDKESVKSLVYPSVFNTYQSFFKCSGCDKIYYKSTEHVNYKTAKVFAKEFSYNPDTEENCTACE